MRHFVKNLIKTIMAHQRQNFEFEKQKQTFRSRAPPGPPGEFKSSSGAPVIGPFRKKNGKGKHGREKKGRKGGRGRTRI